MLTVVIAALSIGGVAPRAAGQGTGRPARVLVLYQQQAETQPMLDFTERLRRTIREELASPVEFYLEALDFDRFTGRGQKPTLADYFDGKYRGFPIDVVVPIGNRALGFAIEHLSRVLPNVPIAFALCAAPQVDPLALPANVTGRLAPASRFALTFTMARRLQPDAQRFVVIGGAGQSDSGSIAAAVGALRTLGDTLPLTVFQGLSLDSLLRAVHELPSRSIVVFANYRHDPNGQAFEPLDIVGSIARAASAPMYAQVGSYVGEGIVGGSVTRFDDEGARTGRLVARVLKRAPGQRMPPPELIGNSLVVDWRQLRRWALSEKRLSPGTTLLFREATLWQRYRSVVLVVLGVISAEMLLIGLLLVERRQRKQAQLVLREQEYQADEARRQVAHMGRAALVGELAATISHDLRQPLAAIRANAEAGALLVARGSVDTSEMREIFHSIVADDTRAVEVIETVRKLLRKEKPLVTTVDLNEICFGAVRLLQRDALLRNARLQLTLASSPSTVLGDPVQLQQVVLNLLLNGLEAASMSQTERFVMVQTECSVDHVDVVVHDSGPGIPAAVHSHLFEPFFSTKTGGLGLGLVIVRSIVERHSGRIRAENHSLGGAVLRVRLPRAGRVKGVAGAPTRDAVVGTGRARLSPAESPRAENSKLRA